MRMGVAMSSAVEGRLSGVQLQQAGDQALHGIGVVVGDGLVGPSHDLHDQCWESVRLKKQ